MFLIPVNQKLKVKTELNTLFLLFLDLYVVTKRGYPYMGSLECKSSSQLIQTFCMRGAANQKNGEELKLLLLARR